eukprot:TRINITY_DN14047_c0_g2_i1.p1 TRINITY_DN14047_c0_g2~~TRINITY_DN14047_c0_g2_i1.p1  ORF type:complete len:382 (+),score=104.69 TRINITY_DN14047_c0_g2_i1:89-1147(+)
MAASSSFEDVNQMEAGSHSDSSEEMYPEVGSRTLTQKYWRTGVVALATVAFIGIVAFAPHGRSLKANFAAAQQKQALVVNGVPVGGTPAPAAAGSVVPPPAAPVTPPPAAAAAVTPPAVAVTPTAAAVTPTAAAAGALTPPSTAAAAAAGAASVTPPTLPEWVKTGKFTPLAVPKGTSMAGAKGVLTPAENLNDGNVCGDDEEFFENLCYKKCSLLTAGTHPIRTTAFSCCAAPKIEECGLKNQLKKAQVCGGFDVAGEINGQSGACPHKKGTCLEDEELFLGTCYKKCTILTNSVFPHRSGAMTCCKNDGLTGCLPFSGNIKTDIAFDKGGAASGKDSKPHSPEKTLTEAS